MTQNFQVSTAHLRMGTLIDTIFEIIPSTTVILAKLLPNGDPLAESNTLTFNANLDATVANLTAQGRKVSLVDMHSDWFSTADLGPDGTHPNELGYLKMSRVFYTGIVAAANGEFESLSFILLLFMSIIFTFIFICLLLLVFYHIDLILLFRFWGLSFGVMYSALSCNAFISRLNPLCKCLHHPRCDLAGVRPSRAPCSSFDRLFSLPRPTSICPFSHPPSQITLPICPPSNAVLTPHFRSLAGNISAPVAANGTNGILINDYQAGNDSSAAGTAMDVVCQTTQGQTISTAQKTQCSSSSSSASQVRVGILNVSLYSSC